MPAVPELHIFSDPQELATKAADFFLKSGEQAIAASNRFLVALSGGATPKALYAMLTSPTSAGRLDWSKVHFLFGDERCVPPSHPDSNFAMANETLFAPLKISSTQIHRMRGEDPPETAAARYEDILRRLGAMASGEWPVLDLILLGMGNDGHTASLFPGTASLNEQTRWVVPSFAPQGTRSRLTLTLGVINHASVILFLVAGLNKAHVVQQVLDRQPTNPVLYPAELVQPQNGRLLWYLDRAAASRLPVSAKDESHEGFMILAGDIGGTKTNLALYEWTTHRIEPVHADSFHSADYQALEEIVEEFLSTFPPKTSASDKLIDEVDDEEGNGAEIPAQPELPPDPIILTAACFGVAGPVIDNRCRTTNLPWVIDGDAIAQRFNIAHVQLLNDLEATAHGLLLLRPDEVVVLNTGTPPKKKQALALIAAGTGLGECILCWDGARYRPMPSEGGHTDFAPNSDSEIELLRHLRGSYLHVSYERIVSGPGLHAVYDYLRDTKKNEPTWLAEKIKVGDPAAEIAQAGLNGQAEIATQALDMFASIYGAEAGNLALKGLTLDGVYVAGGIAPKLLKKLQDGSFMRGFTNKGRYKRLMTQIPVKVVVNDKTALLGAASVAAQLARAIPS